MIRLAISSLALVAAFQYAYVTYVSRVFGYANYRYFPVHWGATLATYLLALAPVLFWRDKRSPAALGASIIYVFAYVPVQVMMPYMLDSNYYPVLAIQGSISASMIAIFITSAFAWKPISSPITVTRQIRLFVYAASLVTIALTIALNYAFMRIVSFDQVYNLREEANAVNASPIVGYLTLWLAYCFGPFALAVGITERKLWPLLLGLLGCLVIYMSMGAKGMVFLPVFILAFYILDRLKRNFMSNLCAAMAVVILLLLAVPNDGPLSWIKNVLLVRTMASEGWSTALYYEYFTSDKFTWYSHINIVNLITHLYPYGSRSLGQIIGLAYSNSDAADFNANFWASDGFAAMGLPGIAVVTVALCGFLVALNRLASSFDAKFVRLWTVGFWIALLNVPLSTALLSGGGLLILLLLWSGRRSAAYRGQSTHAAEPPAGAGPVQSAT